MKTELQDLINDCSSELEDIKVRIQKLKLDKAKDYLTKYALIKASGTIEFVYRSIIADYFETFNIPQINHYLEITVRTGSLSASYDNMAKLLGKFDDDWNKTFTRNVKKNNSWARIKDSSNSLVKNRHLFAHGKPPTATFEDIYNYYFDCLELVKEFDSVVYNSNNDDSG